MNKICLGTSFPLLHLHLNLEIQHFGQGASGDRWGFIRIPKASLNGINQHIHIECPGHPEPIYAMAPEGRVLTVLLVRR